MNVAANWRGKDVTAEERFMSKLVLADGCWTFVSHHDRDGYPTFSVAGHACRASRFVFEWLIGALGPGYLVCHTCDNPGCVNPYHMFKGTICDNNQDRARKGRSSKQRVTHCRKCGTAYERSKCPACQRIYHREYYLAHR